MELDDLKALLELLREFGVTEYRDEGLSLRLGHVGPSVPTFDQGPVTDDERELLGLPPLPRRPGT